MKHGEGKKWYLNTRNYVKERFRKDRERKEFAYGFLQNMEKITSTLLSQAVLTWAKDPTGYDDLRRQVEDFYIKMNLHQVVPLEDALKILDIASPIAKFACVCRRIFRGINEKCCLGFGISLDSVREWPDFYRDGIDYISREEAKKLVKDFEERGLVHAVAVMKEPYISAMCHCDYPNCLPLRLSRERGWRGLKRGEYVAVIDLGRCDGCRECISYCQFGALTFSPTHDIPVINSWKCFGCGVCRQVCIKEAIRLTPRENFPPLLDVWW
jgi:Pyruvate/2-oxoacid:ferredoxin oxidoreductase delta subunit